MKLTGNTDDQKRLQLRSVVLTATPDEVRNIAEFLSDTADRMDGMGSDHDYDHLSDHTTEFGTSPDLIVVQASQDETNQQG